MKTRNQAAIIKSKLPQGFTIDPTLDESQNETLFPQKLEQANKVLRTAKLPPNKNR